MMFTQKNRTLTQTNAPPLGVTPQAVHQRARSALLPPPSETCSPRPERNAGPRGDAAPTLATGHVASPYHAKLIEMLRKRFAFLDEVHRDHKR